MSISFGCKDIINDRGYLIIIDEHRIDILINQLRALLLMLEERQKELGTSASLDHLADQFDMYTRMGERSYHLKSGGEQ